MKTDHMSSVTAVFKDLGQAQKAIQQLIDQAIPAGYISLVAPEHQKLSLQQEQYFGIPVQTEKTWQNLFVTGKFADRLENVSSTSFHEALIALGYSKEEAGFYSHMLQDAVLMLVVVTDTSIQISRVQDIARQNEGIIYHREKDPEEENLPRPSQML
ncbi:hypothetical protein [Deinococcus cellulosilyticus]|uniref:Uncharacterized protein n=1 Tax=Deinococcus cellulosilyticus (strain DSM 18568 / NBRC 106333 / KACC 11606 / 5516J-15) TaxID=1223518 RepID=A0A511N5X6_DEIC1|nr:hypothetical protein [Deinococcus cellulosilyticus]GEM47836.1 hypothetical protein DC3_34710 [Deinococcus cellulosilyticus NBRC 106333 = KACC 11606]